MTKPLIPTELTKEHNVTEAVEKVAQVAIDHSQVGDRKADGTVPVTLSKDYVGAALETQSITIDDLKRLSAGISTIVQGEALAVATLAPGILADDKEAKKVSLTSQNALTKNVSTVMRESTVRNPSTSEETIKVGSLQSKSTIRVSAKALDSVKAVASAATVAALAE